MNAAEIRALSDAEIQEKIDDAKEEMLNLRFQLASGQLEDVSRTRVVRRNVARLLTILRERQLAAQVAKENR